MTDVSAPPKTKGMAATLSTQSLVSAWEQFLTDYYKLRIEEAALNYPETRSVDIDYNDLDRRDPNLAQYLLDHPRASIQSSEEALRLIEVPVEPRPALRIRIHNLPAQSRYDPQKLRAEHNGQLVAILGTVRSMGPIFPRLISAIFQCRRCGAVFAVEQEDLELQEPEYCEESQGGCGREGPFRMLPDDSRFTDRQRIEVSARTKQTPSFAHVIEALTPRQFEQFVADVFESANFSVERMPLSRDFGADLIAEKDGVRTVIQVKKKTGPVGSDAIVKTSGAVAHYKADEALVVSASGYTSAALEAAERGNVRTVGLEELRSLMDPAILSTWTQGGAPTTVVFLEGRLTGKLRPGQAIELVAIVRVELDKKSDTGWSRRLEPVNVRVLDSLPG